VAVFLPNCLEYYLVYWAVVRLGGVIVPLNTWLRSDGIASVLESVRPEILVVGSQGDTAALDAARAAKPRGVFALDPGRGNLRSWESLLEPGPAAPVPQVGPEDVSIIMHTSGTTAAPKGAVMRHCDLTFNIMAAINGLHFRTDDVHMLVNPMFHCTAMYTQLPLAAHTGTPVIIASPTDPEKLLRLVDRERITTFLSTPPVFRQLLKVRDAGRYDTSCLRLIAYAGSPMPVGTIRELRARFPGVRLHNFFGLTETISLTHVLDDASCETRPDSVGRLVPHVSAVIVDEEMRRLPGGRVGELLFARENVVPCYHDQPGRLDKAIVEMDGRKWFRTGDLAMVDEDGYFFIKGRKKDMIIVGGENVYAVEIEAVLSKHPKVREAAVKGVSAAGAASFLGEQINAYVVSSDDTLTERDLREYCHERLPSYKIPRVFRFLPGLPRNPSGKVVKGDLPG
jgi:acyl-CoA synthetase (AMP-forming)/AMP-acid ligase II